MRTSDKGDKTHRTMLGGAGTGHTATYCEGRRVRAERAVGRQKKGGGGRGTGPVADRWPVAVVIMVVVVVVAARGEGEAKEKVLEWCTGGKVCGERAGIVRNCTCLGRRCGLEAQLVREEEGGEGKVGESPHSWG